MERLVVHRWSRTKKAGLVACTAALILVGLFQVPVYRFPVASFPVVKLTFPGAGRRTGIAQMVFLAVVTGNVREAIDTVREERARTRAEHDAFDAFIERVDAIPPQPVQPTPAQQQSVVRPSLDAEDRLQQVVEAYEETVMDVSHYEMEYDDTVAESLTEELGPEWASQLLSGGSFTPLVKRRLLEAARQCRTQRAEFRSILETEESALQTARRTLEDVDARIDAVTARLPSDESLDDLVSNYARFEEAERECEAILEERQQHRTTGHANVDPSRLSIHDLHAYLYQDLPVEYPVLTDTLDVLDRLRRLRRGITKEFAARY